MFATFKMIALTAALSAGAVTAYELPASRDVGAPSGKTFYDRVLPSDPTSAAPKAIVLAAALGETREAGLEGKSDSLRSASGHCAAQTWPNISRDCLAAADGTPARKVVRTITIEQRESANTSTLVRLPASDAARR